MKSNLFNEESFLFRSAARGYEEGLQSYLSSVYAYMAGGLAISGLVGYLAAASGFYQQIATTPMIWIVMIAPLALLLFLTFRIDRLSVGAAHLAFWAYAALIGLSIAGIFLVYTGTSIASTFFISAATFGSTSLYGHTTRRDLSRFGSFLFMALLGFMTAILVNIFMASTRFEFVISIAGVLLFVGLTAYDTQRIKEGFAASEGADAAARKAILGALTLYLDFINLFLVLLRLTGTRRR